MNKKTGYIYILLITVFVCVVYQGDNGKQQAMDALEERCFSLEETLYHQITMQCQQYNIINNAPKMNLKQRKSIYTLLYCYPGGGCQPCIDKDLELLNDCKKYIGKESIVIIASQSNSRDYKIRIKSLFKDFNMIFLSDKEMYIPKDNDGMVCRYFALMDSTSQISNVFFPYLGRDATSAYLKRLCYDYW